MVQSKQCELMLRSANLNVYTTDFGEEGIDLGNIITTPTQTRIRRSSSSSLYQPELGLCREIALDCVPAEDVCGLPTEVPTSPSAILDLRCRSASKPSVTTP